jgi:dehydrogenase/reductase SDR family member 12
MDIIDRTLDATLVGYTKLGVSLRGVDTSEQFPAIEGKHVMVTGATGGIGEAVAIRLAANGAIVHVVGRSEDKLAALADGTVGEIVTHRADLSSMAQITAMADAFHDSGAPLHGLVNNVGVMRRERSVTEEGFEATYATNLLGQYLLTRKLLPILASSAPSRIVMVSSGGMYSQGLTASNIESEHGDYNGTTAYARTKRAEVVLMEEWADEFRHLGVTVNAMHPGWVDTAGVRSSLPTFRKLTGPLLRDADQGADTIVWLIASSAAGDETGAFWHDRQKRPTHRMGRTVEDPDTRRRFMEKVASDAAPWLEEGARTPNHSKGTD